MVLEGVHSHVRVLPVDRGQRIGQVALEASGEYARALGEYKRALELDPKDTYIRRNYARFAEFYTSFTRTTGKAASGS